MVARLGEAKTAHGAGAPVDYVVQALLASVAGVCGAGVLARVTETWHEPVILWQALVGGPSNDKTPASMHCAARSPPPRRTTAPEARPRRIDQDTASPALSAAARSGRPERRRRDEPAGLAERA